MAEDFEQLPLFHLDSDPVETTVKPTREAIVSTKLAEAANEHAMAIDLIALNMRLHKTMLTDVSARRYVELEREWDAIAGKLLLTNSPVVAFLVSLVSDLTVQLCGLRNVSHEAALAQMRSAASQRLDLAEQAMLDGEQ